MIVLEKEKEKVIAASDTELDRYRTAKGSGLRTVFFVSTGNSIRSQIAEGLVNHIFGEKWAAFSAGAIPIPVPDTLTKVMLEDGIDLRGRKEKHVATFRDCEFDLAIVLCSDVDRICPVLPVCDHKEYMIFEDPLSSFMMYEGFCLGFTKAFRRLRDDMKEALTAYMQNA
ncbi:MAG TPA: hypothetical protein VMB78_08855 [Dissulfurispiraceae bacterium]|nr:hypothetical protein [Dissulfurispiraceae bacterium]